MCKQICLIFVVAILHSVPVFEHTVNNVNTYSGYGSFPAS